MTASLSLLLHTFECVSNDWTAGAMGVLSAFRRRPLYSRQKQIFVYRETSKWEYSRCWENKEEIQLYEKCF